MRISGLIVVIVFIVTVLLVSFSLFVVDQRQNAIVFQFGEAKRIITNPGLHWKVPVLQNVRYFDTRILTFDLPQSQRINALENKPVKVDYFVKWRITDVRQFYASVQGDEKAANNRLLKGINDGLQEEFGKRTVHDVVSGERDKIMSIMREKADLDARKIGVHVVDVRLKRVDLPAEVSQSVFDRMQTDRKQVANDIRSRGVAEGEKIRADADKQKEIILAEANREAQRIKGEGDAKASAIYAQAFNQDPEFYAFYRSLEAYRQSFKNKNDVLIIEPNSEFFRYLRGATKGNK